MAKRRLDTDDSPPAKRARSDTVDRLSQLSDEILLRILSYLPVQTLIRCQRLSRKFQAIAGDSQLWKAAYYNRFVRPRALRIPGMKDGISSPGHLLFSSRISKWLDEEHLLKREKETDWKRQYKLRHNWSRGACVVDEIELSEEAPDPPLLAIMHHGIIFTADSIGGLRAWSSKGTRGLLAKSDLTTGASVQSLPTSLAVDGSCKKAEPQRVVVGYENGRFDILEFQPAVPQFRKLYGHPASSNGMLSAVAYYSPYLITMTDSQLLSVYSFPTVSTEKTSDSRAIEPPQLLQSLTSHITSSPLSLCIRRTGEKLVASIAFTLVSYSGFSVGIQEMHLSLAGVLLESRLATSADAGYQSLSSTAAVPSSKSKTQPDGNLAFNLSRVRSKPTSLSYTHPYLLVTHPDNTLTLFIVKSTATALTISAGSRLWGHTSSVSGAHISGKGRAVSVSRRGGELRVWELEGGILASSRKRVSAGELSVRVRPEERTDSMDLNHFTRAILHGGSSLGLAAGYRLDDASISQGWVGFDEENVVLLREKHHGGQALAVYDFT